MVRTRLTLVNVVIPVILVVLFTWCHGVNGDRETGCNRNDYNADFEFEITDEQYYSMPVLFHLDNYDSCLSRRHLYCLGSFDLYHPDQEHPPPLLTLMKHYSENWVVRYNHTRVHRGMCVSHRCPQPPADRTRSNETFRSYRHNSVDDPDAAWFSSCVNQSISTEYGIWTRLRKLEYCERRVREIEESSPPMGASERVLASVVAIILVLAALSTTVHLTLNPGALKGAEWAIAWSIPGCWKELQSGPGSQSRSTPHHTDLSIFDGIRVLCMVCVIVEHVCWLSMLTFVAEPRWTELRRREADVMLLTNSTLVVQIFFMMSSFLLAHKLLQQKKRAAAGIPGPSFWRTVYDTMVARIVRISPSYWLTVWLAASWWPRVGSGPLWSLVEAEAEICRTKWWTHLLYLNNVLHPDDKCLIQTWYLAADMQLYLGSLILTLLLLRYGKAAVIILASLLIGSIVSLAVLAYAWTLLPTFIMHRPECVRDAYSGSASFNILYQSPFGNISGALLGLLLAHLHHYMLDNDSQLHRNWIFRVVSVWMVPLSVVWAGRSPLCVAAGGAGVAGAGLAALERPVFAAAVAVAILGAVQGVDSPLKRFFAWPGWRVPARLSFAALLLHMPLNKSLVALRTQPTQLDRTSVIFEWWGVCVISWVCAVPLYMLVELPCLRLYRALTANKAPRTQTHKPSKRTDRL